MWTNFALFNNVSYDMDYSSKDFVFISFFSSKLCENRSFIGMVKLDMFSFLLAPPSREYKLMYKINPGKVLLNATINFKYYTTLIVDNLEISPFNFPNSYFM